MKKVKSSKKSIIVRIISAITVLIIFGISLVECKSEDFKVSKSEVKMEDKLVELGVSKSEISFLKAKRAKGCGFFSNNCENSQINYLIKNSDISDKEREIVHNVRYNHKYNLVNKFFGGIFVFILYYGIYALPLIMLFNSIIKYRNK